MELVDKSEISTFIAACDKMISSKYIMVDKRVADVLTSIAECKPVYNLIAECMINFNFDKAFKQGTVGHTFVLPEDPKDLVAFVFCLLNCFDDKKININELLMKFYSTKDNSVGPYALFNNEVMIKFKNAVYFLSVGEKIEKEEPKPAPALKNFDADINNRLIFLATDLKDYVSGVKKIKGSYLSKSEMLTIILSFIELVKNNISYAYKACLIGIKAGAGKDKELLKRIAAIDEILVKLLVD